MLPALWPADFEIEGGGNFSRAGYGCKGTDRAANRPRAPGRLESQWRAVIADLRTAGSTVPVRVVILAEGPVDLSGWSITLRL